MHHDPKPSLIAELTRAVAHLYAIAGALAGPYEWDTTERLAELDRVRDMLMQAHGRLDAMPACAASVREQLVIVTSVESAPLDDVSMAMALARSGLVLNTWCSALAMQTSTGATDGPLTLGGLMQLIHNLQPDERYQTALIEKLSAVAYENSAIRQLGTCYFQAFEGYSLLELHQLLELGEPSRAADLLDNAGRGALTAVRFLQGQPIDEGQPINGAETTESCDPDHATAASDPANPEPGPANPEPGPADAAPDHATAEPDTSEPEPPQTDGTPPITDEPHTEAQSDNEIAPHP